MEKNQLNHCGFVKTILMILIVSGHSCAFWSGNWFTGNPAFESHGLCLYYLWGKSFVTYAFGLVSGYLFAYKIRGGEYREYGPFLKNKAKRLLVPYVFVMAAWVAPITVYFFKPDVLSLIKTYVLCIDPSQLWFLWMLFGVFSIVWPLRKLMTERPVTGWIIAIVSCGIGTVGEHFLPNVFCIWTACRYLPFFYIGMRIRTKEENGEKRITESLNWTVWTGLHMIGFLAVMLVSGQSGMVWKLMHAGLSISLNFIGAIMAWTALQSFAAKANWKESRLFKRLSSYSMPVYLFHQQIIYFTIVWLNGKLNPWIHAGVNFAAALIGSLLISSILMHWKTTRFLIGEK